MLFEYFDLKEEGTLIRKAVDASLDENVRTPEIQVEGGAKYGTKEVGFLDCGLYQESINFIGFYGESEVNAILCSRRSRIS